MAAVLCCACSGRASGAADSKDNTETEVTLLGNFNADSAYTFIERQVAFGPRVPGTGEHDACAEYLIGELERLGTDTLMVQRGIVTAFNGDVLPITNIFGSFRPEVPRRVLLAAHWDTRPWADKEVDEAKRSQPVPGANDGGSGVGVLLEIARNLGMKAPEVGVDILFVDAEDYGNDDAYESHAETWCLGSQYWAANMPYSMNNMPVYGILLDMVGGKDARFHFEGFSLEYARSITMKVWSEAQQLRLDHIFVQKPGGIVTDDHVFLAQAGIPTTDIIETNNVLSGTFPPSWHTLSDDMSNISKSTLKAVGETVLNVIYKEKEQ